MFRYCLSCVFFFFSSRRRHTRFDCDWSSDVCSSDLMPAEAETVAIVRKNFVVLWSTSGIPVKGAKKPPAPKIKEIGDLAGHRVGVIGRTPANAALLRVILTESGITPDKVAVTQFGTNQIEELSHDPNLDAF